MLSEHLDVFFQVFETECCEGDDAFVTGAVDLDHAIFGFHIDGEIEDPIDGFCQLANNAVDSLNGLHFVDLHDHGASARGRAFQFHGRSSDT